MNKLEEQIQNACLRNTSVNGEIPYRNGAQFVIDLELPVKFAEWFQSRYEYHEKGVYVIQYDDDEKPPTRGTIKELYQFWIDNIYGK
jgi:hypothetical protein